MIGPIRHTKPLVLGVTGLIAAFGIAACGGSSASGGAGGGSAAPGPAPQSVKIVLPTAVEGNELDPDVATGYELDVAENVFDTLFKFNHQGVPGPGLALNDVVSDHGLVHTLKLRQGVTFQNGQKMTSADVQYSLERQQGLLPGYRNPLGTAGYTTIKSVKTAGPYKVVITLRKPQPDLKNVLAYSSGMVMPKAYLQKVGTAGFDKHPIGTGPYEFVSQSPGQDIVLKRYSGYWGPKPKIDDVTFTFNTDQASRAAEVEAGTVDVAIDVDPSQVESLTSRGLKIVPLKLGNVQYIAMNSSRGDLANPKVGVALNMAINKAAIIKSIYANFPTPAASLDSSLSTASKSLKPYPYDPAKAKAMLKAAGFDFSKPLTMAVPIGRWADSTSLVAAIVSNLAAIGVKVNVENLDLATWAQKNGSDTLGVDLNLTGIPNNYYDPIPQWGNTECHHSYSMWCQPALDQRISQAGALGGSQRVKATQGVDTYMHDHPPGIFLFQIVEIEAISSKLNWDPTQGSAFILLSQLS